MDPIKNIGKGIVKAVKFEGDAQLYALKDLDRLVAAEFGAPEYYTISAETAKHWELRPLKDLLDAIQAKHAEGALVHDQAVQAASDVESKKEKQEGLP